jgi:hypothetical protein
VLLRLRRKKTNLMARSTKLPWVLVAIVVALAEMILPAKWAAEVEDKVDKEE